MFKWVGLLDTPFAVSVAHLILTLPMAVWMLVTYFRSIPEDLDQAAMLDGASHLQILWIVIIPDRAGRCWPRSRSSSSSISWNEFLLAFILTSRNSQTVPVAVASLAGTMSFDWPLIAAVSVASMIPALIFVGFAQRHIVSGLGSGAVK